MNIRLSESTAQLPQHETVGNYWIAAMGTVFKYGSRATSAKRRVQGAG